MKKISSAQLVVLLFVTRAFLSMTYGVAENGINIVLCMISILVSTAVQVLMITPPLIACEKNPDKDFLQLAYLKSPNLGRILSVCYGAYFIFEACRNMGIFSYFLKNQFLDYLPVPILIIALVAASVYGAGMGLQAIARTSVAAVVLFVAIFLIIIFGVTGEYDFYNIQLATPVSLNPMASFIKDVSDKIGRSTELVAFVFLIPYVNRKKAASAFTYLGIKLVFMELIVFYSALILGEYAENLSLPFYTLSTYAKTSIVERYDSIYMGVWTVGSFVKTVLLMYLAGKCLENLGVKFAKTAGGLIPTAIALILALLGKWDSVFFRSPSTIVVVILTSILPLLFCFSSFKKKTNERNAVPE